MHGEIPDNPPDIILTNYVMLELTLTRVYHRELVKAAQGLCFLVLEKLHTYRVRHLVVVGHPGEALEGHSLMLKGEAPVFQCPATQTV